MPRFNEYRIVVMGGGGVGKSALTTMYMTNNFIKEYDPTIEDNYRKQVVVDGEVALLDILDTAGQEEYSAMRDQYINFGKGFLLAYSITSRISYDELIEIHQSILRAKDTDCVPMVLCATKSDLEDERVISKAEGADLASNLKCPFFESSAKTHVNVDEVFSELVRVMRKEDKLNEPADAGNGDKKKWRHKLRRKSKEQCSIL